MNLRDREDCKQWFLMLGVAHCAICAFLVVVGAAAAERPALVDAAKTADAAALRALLQKKVDVNVSDSDGTTALHNRRR